MAMAQGPDFSAIMSSQAASASMASGSQIPTKELYEEFERWVNQHGSLENLGLTTIMEHVNRLFQTNIDDIKTLLDEFKKYFGDIKGVPELTFNAGVKMSAEQSILNTQAQGLFSPSQQGAH